MKHILVVTYITIHDIYKVFRYTNIVTEIIFNMIHHHLQ